MVQWGRLCGADAGIVSCFAIIMMSIAGPGLQHLCVLKERSVRRFKLSLSADNKSGFYRASVLKMEDSSGLSGKCCKTAVGSEGGQLPPASDPAKLPILVMMQEDANKYNDLTQAGEGGAGAGLDGVEILSNTILNQLHLLLE